MDCYQLLVVRSSPPGRPFVSFPIHIGGYAFSQMIQQMVNVKDLHGAKASCNGPKISYLLFADEGHLLTRAIRYQCLTIVDIIKQI